MDSNQELKNKLNVIKKLKYNIKLLRKIIKTDNNNSFLKDYDNYKKTIDNIHLLNNEYTIHYKLLEQEIFKLKQCGDKYNE